MLLNSAVRTTVVETTMVESEVPTQAIAQVLAKAQTVHAFAPIML